MKIMAATNKRKSLEKLAEYERTIYQLPRYSVDIDIDKNIVTICDRYGRLIDIIYPDTKPVSVNRYKFRKASQADIDNGEQLYVKERYSTVTQKQLAKPLSRVSVAGEY